LKIKPSSIFFRTLNSLHRFTIENGHVTYQNRILQSDSYQQAHQTGQLCYSEYGTSKDKENCNILNKENQSESTLSWFYSR